MDSNRFRWLPCKYCGSYGSLSPTTSRSKCLICGVRSPRWLQQRIDRQYNARQRNEDKVHWQWRLLNYIEFVLGGPKSNLPSSLSHWQEFEKFHYRYLR